ncbi:MAG: NAD(P)H-hydrate dehydratase [Candidatus Caldatribacteriota bacterium]
MKIVSSKEMKEIDQQAILEYGIPGLILMENAGIKIFQRIKEVYPDLKSKRVVVLAGSGNNGGDSFVVARHLYNYGVRVRVMVVNSPLKFTKETKTNWEIINKMGLETILLEDFKKELIEKHLQEADLVIDGLLGTGLRGPVRGLVAEIITLVNQFKKEKIAIDVPSGLNSDQSIINGPCIQADLTITLGLPKIGLWLYPGAKYAGKVFIEDIGIPQPLLENQKLKMNTLDRELIKKLLPSRVAYGHKGTFGKVLLLAGSKGMTGAAYLSSMAAIKSGAGLVYLGIPESLNPIMEMKLTEVITIPMQETKVQSLGEGAAEEIINSLLEYSVLGIGPGLSRYPETQKLVRRVVEKTSLPLVLDADAIYALRDDLKLFQKISSPIIITPHPGELANLLNKDINYILDNQLEIAREIASTFGIIVLLKGARTIIVNQKGEGFINISDNSGMATAGSGDVLTGIICGLIAQKINSFEAALIGVYIHSRAGNIARKIKGERGMIAGDILEQIPLAFLSLDN